MELYNVMELLRYFLSGYKRTIPPRQVYCCCTLFYSTWSSKSITTEFTCEVYYLAGLTI